MFKQRKKLRGFQGIVHEMKGITNQVSTDTSVWRDDFSHFRLPFVENKVTIPDLHP
jgi:hypothetical protein